MTNVNEAPTITSSASATASENVSTTTAIYTAGASDPDANTALTYSISGGADAALFAINASSGEVTFKASPNFEAPADGGANNVYDIIVQASDGTLVATKSVAITVTNVNEAPTITSSASATTPEKVSITTTVYKAIATDPDSNAALTYSIYGGNDEALFAIDASSGAVTFKASPNFEVPSDTGTNNIYNIVVKASDGSLTDTQAVAITVTNVNEAPTLSAIALGSTFTEAPGSAQGSAVAIFKNAAISTIESNQKISSLSFNVTGVVDGLNEKAIVDGTALSLVSGMYGKTRNNDLNYSVFAVGKKAFITLSKDLGISTTAAQTLINEMSYQNTSIDDPTSGTRVFTLTQIKDTGGTASGGSDTRTLDLVSHVYVATINDAPTLSMGLGDKDAARLNTSERILATTGTLTVGDVDNTSVDRFVVDVRATGSVNGAAKSNQALLKMLSVTPSTVTDLRGTSATLNWAFNSMGSDFSYLGNGEKLLLTYTVRVTDAGGLSNSKTISITINGYSPAIARPSNTNSAVSFPSPRLNVSSADIEPLVFPSANYRTVLASDLMQNKASNLANLLGERPDVLGPVYSHLIEGDTSEGYNLQQRRLDQNFAAVAGKTSPPIPEADGSLKSQTRNNTVSINNVSAKVGVDVSQEVSFEQLRDPSTVTPKKQLPAREASSSSVASEEFSKNAKDTIYAPANMRFNSNQIAPLTLQVGFEPNKPSVRPSVGVK